ncbi:MAG: hypothetical protein UR60_C0027G0001 [Candidatus Moranbacteria bacterium GW2011_GWF2_34_56]|nr:MAG: hypothetical protein UR51_C0002G0060 [Candidatus Moranbacteria bacterium GW2011_GWF1_34_10]KKP64166.1 MAG: hypothetical protein UR60_C0027G0001 [Candidatus Moranbacteria bacterium GW2011_GWF2_34_56]
MWVNNDNLIVKNREILRRRKMKKTSYLIILAVVVFLVIFVGVKMYSANQLAKQIGRVDLYLDLISKMSPNDATKISRAILLYKKNQRYFDDVIFGYDGTIEYRLRLDDTVYIFRDANNSRNKQRVFSTDLELSMKDVDPHTGSYYLEEFSEMVTNSGLIETKYLSKKDWHKWDTESSWKNFQDCRFSSHFEKNKSYCMIFQEYFSMNGAIHSLSYHGNERIKMSVAGGPVYNTNIRVGYYGGEQEFYQKRAELFLGWLEKHPELQ